MRSPVPAVQDDDRLHGRRPLIAVGFVVLLGAILRLLWAADMEFKYDEAYLVAAVNGPDPWPWIGQTSGVGTPNPGFGIWVFSAMAAAGFDEPLELVRVVMVSNVVALVSLLAFAWRVVPPDHRSAWLWATALIAVNPVAVLLSRKIWVCSVLPAFVMIVLVAWWRRDRPGSAFVWGVVGALLGQVHMSGFVFAAGLAGWTRLRQHAPTRWRWWFAGSLAGSAPLAPWVYELATSSAPAARSLANTARPDFWIHTAGTVLSFDLFISFGSDAADLLRWPTMQGTPMYLGGLTFAVILTIGALAAAQAIVHLRHDLPRWRASAASDYTSVAVGAAVWGYGLLLTLSGVAVMRHYIIVAFVLPYVGFVRIVLRGRDIGRIVLPVLVVASGSASVLYLTYIHSHAGVPGAEYGHAFRTACVSHHDQFAPASRRVCRTGDE